MSRILISGLGGSLFPYLHQKLVEGGHEPHYVDSNVTLKRVYAQLNFYPAPLVTDPGYKKFILDLCRQKKIEVYVPLIDEELLKAAAIGKEIEGLKVLVPRAEFISLCLNKFELMDKLRETGISLVTTYKADAFAFQIPYPVFAKPNSGRGSRGIRKIAGKAELEAYFILEKFNRADVILQPCLEGTEYTVSVLVNTANKVLAVSPKKIILKKGITISAVTENNSIIEKLARKITDVLQPAGPFNIQLFLSKDSKASVFEINPRFSTTLVMSYEAGLQEISLLTENYFNAGPGLKTAEEGIVLHRNWNNSFYKA